MWLGRYVTRNFYFLISQFFLGHWIHDCPTNSDPNYDKKRIRRTTGIPRSMLEAVDKPVEGTGPLAAGVMVTPDGGYVIARPDMYVLGVFKSTEF